MSNELWLDDIAQLRQVAQKEFPAVGDDLDKSVGIIKTLTASEAAFGTADDSPAVAKAYEEIRAFMQRNTEGAAERIDATGAALVRIADIYQELELKNRPQ